VSASASTPSPSPFSTSSSGDDLPQLKSMLARTPPLEQSNEINLTTSDNLALTSLPPSSSPLFFSSSPSSSMSSGSQRITAASSSNLDVINHKGNSGMSNQSSDGLGVAEFLYQHQGQDYVACGTKFFSFF